MKDRKCEVLAEYGEFWILGDEEGIGWLVER
jgi:hypothetical protein